MARTKQVARKSQSGSEKKHEKATFPCASTTTPNTNGELRHETGHEHAPPCTSQPPPRASVPATGDASTKTLTIHGVSVCFPCKPYPSQLSMMERVIKGLDKQQNCLLESPTGSGKSLALLCAALAWQTASYAKINTQYGDEKPKGTDRCCSCMEKPKQPSSPPPKCKVPTTEDICKPSTSPYFSDSKFEDDDDDFKGNNKSFRLPGQLSTKKIRKHQDIAYEQSSSNANCGSASSSGVDMHTESTCTCTCEDVPRKPKVPKIYFGTRTHKQITQIIRELRKTVYKDVRMCILGSREHCCIHPQLSKLKNKTEACNEKLGPTGCGCKFNENSKKVLLSQSQLQTSGLQEAWDLEDFVSVCKARKACPYFVIRNIRDQADIIFCPYNYLIDPIIRKTMEINLKDQIVILDEAHNMEDAAREAASETVKDEQLDKALKELEQMIVHDIKVAEHLRIKQMCHSLLKFVQDSSTNLQQLDYNQAYKCLSGFDIVARLENMGLGPKHFAEVKTCLAKIFEIDEEAVVVRNRSGEEVKLSNAVKQTVEHLFQPIQYMYKDDMKYVEDYRVAVLKSISYLPPNTEGTWLHSRNKRGGLPMVATPVFTLNFWCMNPAVAFSDLTDTKSIVLTSGTLSPMSTFQSELGTPFPIQLEANHIIKDNQVWVGAISQGPNGGSTQAVYKTMETLTFQDELGMIVEKVCKTVPHGVLCFLPSYKSLQKFKDRWKETGIWDKILQKKKIVTEPKASDKIDFEEVMKYFYDVIDGNHYDEEDDDYGYEIDGALFLAVCRGKVSEGLDFANNNARAVITVGIPYPNFTDIQVKLKREYNDKHSRTRGLLSGSDWYEIQAFRALNQALGRCLRHRKDWGALILSDARFVNAPGKYCKGLSKWMRNKVQPFNNFSRALLSLSDFTQARSEDVEDLTVCSQDMSFIPMTPSVKGAADTSGLDHSSMYHLESTNVITPSKNGFYPPSSHPANHGQTLSSTTTPIKTESTFPQATSTPSTTNFDYAKTPLPTTVTLPSKFVNILTPIKGQSTSFGPTPVTTHLQVVNPTVHQNQILSTLPFNTPIQLLASPTIKVDQSHLRTSVHAVSTTTPMQYIDPTKTNILHLNTGKQSMQLLVPNTVQNNPTQVIDLTETNFLPLNAKNVQQMAEQNTGGMKVTNTHVSDSNSSVQKVSKQSIETNKSGPQTVDNMLGNMAVDSHFKQDSNVVGQTPQKAVQTANSEIKPSHKSLCESKVKDSPEIIDRTPEKESDGYSIEPPDESKKIATESNRFLKFCKLPDRIERILHETNAMIEGHSASGSEPKGKASENCTGDEDIVHGSTLAKRKPLFKNAVSDCTDYQSGATANLRNTSDRLGCNNIVNSEQKDTGEEDFKDTLITRRRNSGGKRRHSSNQKHCSSKRFRGVNFTDETGTSKENQPVSGILKTITCLKCKAILTSSKESEVRQRLPTFLKFHTKRNPELVVLPHLPADSKLQAFSYSSLKGPRLNSTWDTEANCCVQYLQCVGCSLTAASAGAEIVGAEVLCSAEESSFSSGQTWLLLAKVKMS